MTQLWMSRPSPLESPHRGPTLRNKQSAALTACRTRAPVRFCNKPSVVKIREKWLLSLLRCPPGLSVNMKDTAGCGVLIKRLPVHKQLINKRRPSPLPTRLSVSFPFYDRSVLQPLLPWIATSVYYAHGGHSHRHNDTIVTPSPPHATGPSSSQPWGQLTYFWQQEYTEKIRLHVYLMTAALSACRMWCHHLDVFSPDGRHQFHFSLFLSSWLAFRKLVEHKVG